jgi:choice-of-anchor A domain-containing protein
MKTLSAAILILAAASAVTAAQAHAETASSFNAVVRHNFKGTSSDVEGRLAAGGNVSLSNYEVALKDQQPAGRYAIVAGGTFTGGTGSAHGDSLATSYAGNYTVKGTTQTYANGGVSPINIASEMTRLSNLSTAFAANPSTFGSIGSVTYQWDQIWLVGGDSAVNVFNIEASAFDANYGWHLATKPGSVSIFNVGGTSVSVANTGSDNAVLPGVSLGFAAQTYSAANVLYNFHQASALNLLGSVNASILAPFAAVQSVPGRIDGQLFADSFSGGLQINNVKFAGFNPLPGGIDLGSNAGGVGGVPEPAAWALMIFGFGVVGGALRRRKPVSAAA